MNAASSARLTTAQPDLRPVAISLHNVSKSYGSTQALNGINLTIRQGEFITIVGRSGCGKSTLLRLIMGLETPTSGTIETSQQQSRLMFQEPRLLPWASVVENVEVGLPPGNRETARDRALDTLEAVGLRNRAHDWPSILSGGQRQRVALARALVSNPTLLAFDEPLGALDALTRIEMQRLIERVWQTQGFTAALVTHDVSEAVALGDRVILIEDGKSVMDMRVTAPRPRRRRNSEFAYLEDMILERLMA